MKTTSKKIKNEGDLRKNQNEDDLKKLKNEDNQTILCSPPPLLLTTVSII
jgi:hypothetical protein